MAVPTKLCFYIIFVSWFLLSSLPIFISINPDKSCFWYLHFLLQRKAIRCTWVKIMNKCCSLEQCLIILHFLFYLMRSRKSWRKPTKSLYSYIGRYIHSEEYQYLVMVFSIKTFRHIKCNLQFCKSFANMSAKNNSMSWFLRSFRELLSIIIDSFIHSFCRAHSLTVLQQYPL